MKMVITIKFKNMMYICGINHFKMHKVILSIGANTNAYFNIKKARTLLSSYFPSIKFTNAIETKPYGENYTTPFLNSLAYFKTENSKDEIHLQLKLIEKKMGRKPSHKTEGIIIIDIDLIKWNNEVLKPDDVKRDYMQQLLKEIDVIMNN